MLALSTEWIFLSDLISSMTLQVFFFQVHPICSAFLGRTTSIQQQASRIFCPVVIAF